MPRAVLGSCLLLLTVPAVAGQAESGIRDLREPALAELSQSRIWHRAGATLDDYLFDWADCWRVVRGFRPAGGQPTAAGRPAGTGIAPPSVNPTLFIPPGTPVGTAAGLGALAGVGEAAFELVAEADLRRDNRLSCLVSRGWRLGRPDAATAARLSGASETERRAAAAALVGAEPSPIVEERVVYRNFALAPAPRE